VACNEQRGAVVRLKYTASELADEPVVDLYLCAQPTNRHAENWVGSVDHSGLWSYD